MNIDGEGHWLYAVVEPETNVILHVKLYSSRNTATAKMFLRELEERHAIEGAELFVDSAPWLKARVFEVGLYFQHETHGDRNLA